MSKKHIYNYSKNKSKQRLINQVIEDVRTKKNLTEFISIYPLLINNSMYHHHIVGNLFPRNMSEIKISIPSKIELEKELIWYAGIINAYSNKINIFLEKRSNYIDNLLSGNTKHGKSILNDIEQEFGKSLWLLENDIAHISISEGLVKQKDYTNQITNDTSINDLIRFFSFYYSVKAESNISARKFEDILKKYLSTYNLKDDFYTYILYRLNFFGHHFIDNYSTILRYDSELSLIDRYLTFITVCQLICSNKNAARLIPAVKRAISLMSNTINDNALINLKLTLGIVQTEIISDSDFSSVINLLDNYTIGNYSEVIEKCSEWFAQGKREYFEIYELYSKSIVRISYELPTYEDNLRYKIITNLIEVIAKTDKAPEAFSSLLKLVCVHSSLPWASQLYSCLINNYYNDNNDIPFPIIKFCEFNKYPINLSLKGNLLSEISSSPILKLYYALSCREKTESLEVLKHIETTSTLHDTYEAIIYKKFNDFDSAIPIYMKLIETDDILLYQDSIVELVRCYIKKGDISSCIDIISNAVIKNEYLSARLPINEIIDLIEIDQDIPPSISVPIIFHIYSKFIKADKDTIKSEKCEDFLNHYGFTKPSELLEIKDQFTSGKLIFFFRFLCVPQVLDNFIVFSCSKEIDAERISVCQLLTKIDEGNSSVYLDEIKEITERQIMQDAIQEIELSKIHVDINGIRKSIESNLKESYGRYISLSEKTSEQVFLRLGSGKIVLPGAEKFDQFIAMFEELRDHFVSSNEYGLDGYLSVNIRHGTLSGQLRSRVELEKLITSKDNENMYKKNEFWETKYSHIDKETQDKLSFALKEFSKSFDELIDLLKNKWIQIRTEERNFEGLFDFRMNALELTTVQLQANKSSDYDTFVNAIIDYLWLITERYLLVIRDKISTELKEKFNEIFDILLKNVRENAGVYDFEDLISRINNAKTSIPYELDTIANWFRRARESSLSDFDMRLPINIALATIKNIYPTNKIQSNLQVQPNINLKGYTLKSFVSILNMIFDNIIKHSKLEKPQITLEVLFDNRALYISVENNISELVDIPKESLKLAEVQASLDQVKSLDKVRKEGGTGFYKIHKIISFDLGCNHLLKCFFTEKRTFRVEIQIFSKEILAL